MTESHLIRDMPIERRDDLIAQVWAFLTDRGYTITAPGVVSVEERLADMTREARLSRGAAEKAVRARIARHELERAFSAADAPEDSLATEDDLVRYEGRAEAARFRDYVPTYRAADLEALEERFPCDGLCADEPEEDCSRHGRTPTDLWRILDEERTRVQELAEKWENEAEAGEDARYGRIIARTLRLCAQELSGGSPRVMGDGSA